MAPLSFQSLSNTLLQQGGKGRAKTSNRFNGLSKVWKAVKTALACSVPLSTPLKWGVNETFYPSGGKVGEKCSFALLVLLLSGPSLSAATWTQDGTSWKFDTGMLRGNLGANQKSFGLAVTQVSTGQPLSRSMGWFGLYRVFSEGKRYGEGAWDWPSATSLVSNDTLRVDCRADAPGGRPFALAAEYRWAAPMVLDLEITVTPSQDLRGFEVLLASYFDASFSNAAVCVATSATSSFLRRAERSLGEWQMYPRDAQAEALCQDGRWKLLPNPVTWAIPDRLGMPACIRWQSGAGLTALLMAPAEDCFAVSMPHETESHYSAYLSLFGRTLKAGETARAHAKLVLLKGVTTPALLRAARMYTGQSGSQK
jgi:hypothetical protein